MANVLLAVAAGPPSLRSLLRQILTESGCDVREVSDGAAALTETIALPPDVLVLDTALPVYDGLQVLSRLRQQPASRKLPVLVISALPNSLGSSLVQPFGPAAYVSKPIDPARLRAALWTLIPREAPAVHRTRRPPRHRARPQSTG